MTFTFLKKSSDLVSGPFLYVGTKTFAFSRKIRLFCQKTTKFGPKLAFLFIAGLFSVLVVGWLVVVARGLYLARHLFTLWESSWISEKKCWMELHFLFLLNSSPLERVLALKWMPSLQEIKNCQKHCCYVSVPWLTFSYC